MASKTQKVFMLYDLEPSTQVTGGTWYNDAQDYDVAFIKILQHQCYKRVWPSSHFTYSKYPARCFESVRCIGPTMNSTQSVVLPQQFLTAAC